MSGGGAISQTVCCHGACLLHVVILHTPVITTLSGRRRGKRAFTTLPTCYPACTSTWVLHICNVLSTIKTVVRSSFRCWFWRPQLAGQGMHSGSTHTEPARCTTAPRWQVVGKNGPRQCVRPPSDSPMSPSPSSRESGALRGESNSQCGSGTEEPVPAAGGSLPGEKRGHVAG